MPRVGGFLADDEYRRLWLGVMRHECGVERQLSVVVPSAVTARQRRGWRGLALVALLGEMGLRIGEAVGACWSVFAPLRIGSPVVELPGSICKGGRARQVIVTPATAWALRVWMRFCLIPETGRWRGSARVLELGGAGLGVRGGQKMVERYGVRYVGRRVGCHDLRRTFGDRVRRVSDVRIAQLMLGHARLSSTERYLAGSVGERLRAAARIDGALWPDGFTLGSAGWAAWGASGDGGQRPAGLDTRCKP